MNNNTEKNKATGIKTWPEDDRPREKLLKNGAGVLSNSELLAILLRTGTSGTSVPDLARKVLKKFGTFRNMAHTDTRDWKEFKGLGGAKIAHIQAALEIGKRYREDEVTTGKQKIISAKDIVDIVMLQIRDLKTEVFKVVYLDGNNRIIDISDTAVGTVDQAFPIVRENPVKKVKFLKENNKRLRYLVAEEIVKLLKHCKGHLKPIVIIALNTGMRRGEILNLKWHDIDFKRGIIYLLHTKNNEKREIPINDAERAALIKVRKHPDSPYIFCGNDGKPFHDTRTSFFTALKKSGIINFRFHDLRHTFASQLVMSGVDINTVRELLGHKSLEMTLRYSHLSPDHKKRAVDILGKRMDTFWTLDTTKQNQQSKQFSVTTCKQ